MPKRVSKKYFSLPYNPRLKPRAQELRKAKNLSEVLLWNRLKNKQFFNLDFDRQKVIGNYIVDFYCAEKGVVIEIDGRSHSRKGDYDMKRDRYLKRLGLTVIRISDYSIKINLEGIMVYLKNHAAFDTSTFTE